jgi:hypothetical protein
MQAIQSVPSYITDAVFYTAITIGMVAIFIVIGPQVGNRDNTKKVATALTTSYIIGGVVVGVLLLLHVLAILNNTNIEFAKTCMIYLTFFMSYMAMSISLIGITYS